MMAPTKECKQRFQCKKCVLSYDSKRELNKHDKDDHDVKITRFKCEFCDQLYYFQRIYNLHLNDEHLDLINAKKEDPAEKLLNELALEDTTIKQEGIDLNQQVQEDTNPNMFEALKSKMIKIEQDSVIEPSHDHRLNFVLTESEQIAEKMDLDEIVFTESKPKLEKKDENPNHMKSSQLSNDINFNTLPAPLTKLIKTEEENDIKIADESKIILMFSESKRKRGYIEKSEKSSDVNFNNLEAVKSKMVKIGENSSVERLAESKLNFVFTESRNETKIRYSKLVQSLRKCSVVLKRENFCLDQNFNFQKN